MKNAIVCLLAVLILACFAGCTQQPVQTAEPEIEEEIETESVPEYLSQEPVKSEPATTLSNEIKDRIESELKDGVRYSLPLKYQKLKYGEKGVFGVGVQNIMNYEDDFIIKVYFDKAYDKYTNPISVSEDMMNSWVITNLDLFTLSPKEEMIQSVVIEVKDVLPGIKPSAGAYVFDVEILNKEKGFHANKEYVGRQEITVKVE